MGSFGAVVRKLMKSHAMAGTSSFRDSDRLDIVQIDDEYLGMQVASFLDTVNETSPRVPACQLVSPYAGT